MSGVLTSFVAFLVAISILIAVHEFGHFWVARKLGVKVLRYSLGFGRPLWKRTFGKDNIEFVVATLPLGGYVKMLDEREGPVDPAELDRAFNRQPVWKRFAIVFAGPAFNFLFAIFAYWLMFVVGVSGVKPVIGEVLPNTPAAIAGLQAGDEIVKINDRPTPIWDVTIQNLIPALVDHERVELEVQTPQGYPRRVQLDLHTVDSALEPGQLFKSIGFIPWRPAVLPEVGKIVPGSAAARAGLQPGDRIVAIDGQPIGDWQDLVDYVTARPDQDLQLRIQRGEQQFDLHLHTDRTEVDGKVIGRMGIGPARLAEIPPQMKAQYRYPLFAAVGKSVSRTWDNTLLTFKMIGKILAGEVSVKNLSGPINIAVYAGYSASAGLARFMDFLAIVSISLGVLNLLPIPVLDGGHLMFYLVEMVRGRPVSDEVLELGQRIGIALLLLLMTIAFYNDIARLLN